MQGSHQKFRKIIHIDMDAFYASVEERDFPELIGKPLVVGGRPDSRGVVATANYEARKYGIRSAMPCSKAFQLCPLTIFVPPRFEVYSAVSKQIREIFYRYTDLVEPLSLDEAYLDITEDKLNIGSAIEIAEQIRKAIKEELNLTASAGVSINKFVAKIASDINKPDGLTFIGPSKVEKFMEKLPIEKFFGVGKVTAHKMRTMQIFTGADLKKFSEEQLNHQFGKSGSFYYKVVRGIDYRPVRSSRESKSISTEDTLREDTSDPVVLNALIDRLSDSVFERLKKHQSQGKTVTLKIKYSDFKLITRSTSLAEGYQDASTVAQTCKEMLGKLSHYKSIRLLGVGLSNFKKPLQMVEVQEQLRLKL